MEEQADATGTSAIKGGILVGYDSSPGAKVAVDWALKVAELTGWTVHVLRSWGLTTAPRPASMTGGYVPPVKEFGDAVLEQLRSERETWTVPDGVRVELHTAQGQSSAKLLEHAADVDLLVVGARGAGGFRGLVFGSTADQVVRNSPVPVTVVPAPKD
ncbi:universal stress protein [Nocardioides sp. JQ2195]|uniref:universal stress protein n=1 Tax=Nocardioides sp. JQ2195 TaxID=2592334 RepID=UPI00143E4465|nr:universal stress protein [Nocardioides sp. JQ2195]QIX25215.1 universal stress protein [Nocardioides sp. JQ2195]